MRPVTVSVTGVGSSQLVPIDVYVTPTNIGLGVVVTGTVNYTVQHTFDDIWDPNVTPVWFDHPTLAGQTANMDGNIAFAPRAVRIINNSGTGTSALTLVQAGLAA